MSYDILALVNIVDSRAILRVDRGLHIGSTVMGPTSDLVSAMSFWLTGNLDRSSCEPGLLLSFWEGKISV